MTRRKTQRPTRPARKIKAVPAGEWGLIRIDSHPIREKARKEYQKILRELNQTREAIEQFERYDKPKFNQWFHRQFGAVLTQLRELSEKLDTQRQLMFEIEHEADVMDCSYTRAYERVMWRRQHPEAKAQDTSATQPTDATEEDSDNPFSQFEKLFEDLRGVFGEMFEEGGADHSIPGNPPSQPSKKISAELKDLYRAVVRRLHPDVLEQMSPQKQEWWHQAQEAYQSRDADQLRVILTLCEIEEQGSTARTSVSLLMRITRQFKSSLRTLRSQLNKHRRDPAWNFSKSSDQAALVSRTERMLQSELADLKSALHVVENQIAMWARQALSARNRGTRRRSRFQQPEFPF